MSERVELDVGEVVRTLGLTKRTHAEHGRFFRFIRQKLLREEDDDEEEGGDGRGKEVEEGDDEEAESGEQKKTLGRREYRIQDVNVSVRYGDCIALLGANGSGKSTLLEIVAGLMTPDEGTVVGRGNVVLVSNFTSSHVPGGSVRENVRFLWRLYGLDADLLDESWPEVLEFAGLDSAERAAKHLSKTEMRRIFVSAALLSDADVLMFDGPPFRGDEAFVRRCEMKLRHRLAARNLALVFAAGSPKAAEKLASTGIVMDEGRVLYAGPIGRAIHEFQWMQRQGERPDQSLLEFEEPDQELVEVDSEALVRNSRALREAYDRALQRIRLLSQELVVLDDMLQLQPGTRFTPEQAERITLYLKRRGIFTMGRNIDVSIERTDWFNEIVAAHSDAFPAIPIDRLYVVWQCLMNLRRSRTSPRITCIEPQGPDLVAFYEALHKEVEVQVDYAGVEELLAESPNSVPIGRLLNLDLECFPEAGTFAEGRLAKLASAGEMLLIHNYLLDHLDDIDTGVEELRAQGYRVWKPFSRQIVIENLAVDPS